MPEIVRRFPAVPAVAPYDAEDFRRRIDVALDGRPQPADNTSMADYDWSTVARRYVDLYQSVLRPPGVVGVSCIRVKDAI